MASIIDSVQETFEDNHSILKFILYAIPLFVVTNYTPTQIPGYIIVAIIAQLLLFGFMLHCTYNVRIGVQKVLPSFNILEVFVTGLKGLVALAPICIASYFLMIFVSGLLLSNIPDETLAKVFIGIIGLICYSICCTSYLLYAYKFKISDAYNLKAISTYCIDVLIAIIFMIILLAIFNFLIVAPVTYIIWLFFGIPHPIAIFYWSVCAVFNAAICGHYLAQISYEIIEVKENNKR